ncbi:MAG TPA: hypothetical protein VKA46_24710 [Gemmataceae bacterium]|nr:hypothetical protein [Gemmataceae bacterium]
MYHTIQFGAEFVADLEVSSKQPLERVVLRKGDRLKAQVRPYVVETKTGPAEVADLFFEDGTAARRGPFRCFAFVD